MSFITVEVEDEPFQQWLLKTRRGFRSMSETLDTVARIVNEFTLPITPFRTGKLGRSFQWKILENSSRWQVVQVRMSALNERTGYDYAFVQHRGWHKDKNGHYVLYRRFFQGRDGRYYDVSSSHKEIRTGEYSSVTHYGNKQYLYWGIYEAKEDAFELIESDYLSLFTRGHIY